MPSSHRPKQFFAHVPDGKAKNEKNVIPMEHGNDIFENVIPIMHGKHKKGNILFETICKTLFLQHLSSENVIFC